MKVLVLSVLCIGVCFTSIAQDKPSKKMPPLSVLKGKDGKIKKDGVIQIKELPDSTNYQIFNRKGELIESGHAEFINYTDYKKGVYFIKYDGITERFEKK